MSASKLNGFCKSGDCPSSNELLDFENGILSGESEDDILCHISRCEFCSAELEFYSAFPQEPDTVERVESVKIPAPLFQLAEALLKKKHNDPSSLDSLLRENGLVLDKA